MKTYQEHKSIKVLMALNINNNITIYNNQNRNVSLDLIMQITVHVVEKYKIQ